MRTASNIFDVVVVGSGSAGLTAATVAAKLGLSTLLVEKSEYYGGTSAWSGGNCWIPANTAMQGINLPDSLAEAGEYVTSVLGNRITAELLDAFLESCNPMIDFLAKSTAVKFVSLPIPDWSPSNAGAKMAGRALAPADYDEGALSRSELRSIMPPLESFNAPMGMMISMADLPHVSTMFRSPKSFAHMMKVAVRSAVDRLRFGRHARLTMGQALIGRLLRSAIDAGVTLLNRSAALELVQSDGRVTGVVVDLAGERHVMHARRGVVLASGGATADPAQREKHRGGGEIMTLIAPGNVGDGFRMGEGLGGSVNRDTSEPFVWNVLSNVPGSVSPNDRCLHFLDMGKPGRLIVNLDGKRFGNEARPTFAIEMRRAGVESGWTIADDFSLRKHGMGLVWPHGLNMRSLRRRGYLVSAPTIEELAREIQIDPGTLVATIERYNGFADQGLDPDFGRGGSPLDLVGGDPDQAPNPCLGALQVGPFHAVRVYLGNVGSTEGLRVDRKARVLDGEDRPIDGLYACGLDMASIWSGIPMGPGSNHSHNMTFAYIAAQDLAKRCPEDLHDHASAALA